MEKEKKETEQKPIERPIEKQIRKDSNPKIEEIISDYPESLIAHPRGQFEEQLRNHLIKHKVK